MEKTKKIIFQVWENTKMVENLQGEFDQKKDAVKKFEGFKPIDYLDKQVVFLLKEVELEGSNESGWQELSFKLIDRKSFG